MRTPLLLAGCIVLTIYCSCTKSPDSPVLPPQHLLTSFEVTVVERVPDHAVITWSESLNVATSDSIKYKIFLNDSLIDSNLLNRKDILKDLSGTKEYNGKVLAYTASGDTVSAPFFLEKVDGMVFFGNYDADVFQENNLFTGKLLFKIAAGSSGNSLGYSAPVISNDTAFISNNESTGYGLEAFNLNTGELIWNALPYSAGYNTFINSEITYYAGKLYASTRDGVISIDASNGQTVWKNTAHVFNSNPVIDGDKLLVNSGATLFALNVANGETIWQSAHSSLLMNRPVANKGTVYFSTHGQEVYAVNENTGAIIWQNNYVGVNAYYDPIPSPVIFNNILIVGTTESGVYGLNLTNGKTIWHYDNGILGCSQTTLGNGNVYFSQVIGFSSYQTQITAVDATTGKLVWEQTNENQQTDNLIFVNNRLYCGHLGRSIECINAVDGTFLNYVVSSGSRGPFTIRLNNVSYFTADHGNYK